MQKKQKNIQQEKIEGFDEYYKLSEYQRTCLVATNYWRVMWGKPITEVPPNDLHYQKYFDKRCYDLAEAFQRRKRLENEDGLYK